MPRQRQDSGCVTAFLLLIGITFVISRFLPQPEDFRVKEVREAKERIQQEMDRLNSIFRLQSVTFRGTDEYIECYVFDGEFSRQDFLSLTYHKEVDTDWNSKRRYQYVIVMNDAKYAVIPDEPNTYHFTMGFDYPDGISYKHENLGGFQKDPEAMKHIKAVFYMNPKWKGKSRSETMIFSNSAFEKRYD